jgi:hypothetical protein
MEQSRDLTPFPCHSSPEEATKGALFRVLVVMATEEEGSIKSTG